MNGNAPSPVWKIEPASTLILNYHQALLLRDMMIFCRVTFPCEVTVIRDELETRLTNICTVLEAMAIQNA